MQAGQTRTISTSGGGPSRGALRYTRQLKAHSSRSEVSDSEEERQKRTKVKHAALSTVNQNELPVIVISSDEEDESRLSVIAQNGSQSTQPPAEVGPAPAHDHDEEAHSDSEPEELPPVTPRRRHGQGPYTARRIVLSSDEDSAPENETRTPRGATGQQSPRVLDDDVIDLTLSSPESANAQSPVLSPTKPTVQSKKGGKGKTLKTTLGPRTPAKAPDGMLPLFLDDSESEREDDPPEPGRRSDDEEGYDPFSVDDGAILVLDEPRSAQKPVRRPTPSSSTGIAVPVPSTTRSPRKPRLEVTSDSEEEEEVAKIIKPKSRLKGISEPRATTDSTGSSMLTPKTPRMTKKALHERELERRRAYAQAFFEELNRSIFGGGIPAGTELQWNKRLLTTAGRAHWHRTRDGVHETSIQLAEKILDCDERIRNTLSHEMCHLACWIIDGAPTENHGSLFKRWANKIMRKRPEIEVTTRHNYDIKCKYEWKCANCAKVYGRHSKSINPDEQACGVCKIGTLVPQFETRPPRTPKPKADSQNAAARSRDSPITMPGAFPSPSPVKKPATKTHLHQLGDRTSIEISGGGDSDVEILAHTFKSVRIDAQSGLD